MGSWGERNFIGSNVDGCLLACSSLCAHRLVDGPLVLIVEFVDLMSLHVACEDRLSTGVIYSWHLE